MPRDARRRSRFAKRYRPTVRLPEELFLLSHDGSGKPVVHADSLDLGVAGARLVDLVLAGRVGVTAGRLDVVEAVPTGDPESDNLLAAIMRPPTAPTIAETITRLRDGAGERVRDGLLADGAITKVNARRLGLIAVIRYPADEAMVRTINVRLWYAAHGRSQPEARTAALCGLVHAVLLHDHVFVTMPMTGLGQRLREIRERLSPPVKEIVDTVGELVSPATFAIFRASR